MEQTEGAIASFFIHPVLRFFLLLFLWNSLYSINCQYVHPIKILYDDNNLQKTLQLTEIQVGKQRLGTCL